MKEIVGKLLQPLIDSLLAIRQWLGERLLPLADWILSVMASIPLGVVRILFLGLLAGLAVWVWSLGPQLPGSGETRFKVLRDLRLFAVLLLALQAIPYLIF